MYNMSRRLTVGAFQFAATDNIEDNLKAIERGIRASADKKVRLLLTQECALCGYPPLEVPSTDAIDKSALKDAYERIRELACKYSMYIALGMITFEEGNTFNSVYLIDPEMGSIIPYHKRALWGWDSKNYSPGNNSDGIYIIDGIKVGTRICYEVRFPEYFRELFSKGVELALVSFADVGSTANNKLNVIKSHLISRAAENAMYVLSANSTSQNQLAPTCLIDPDGKLLDSALLNEESLLSAEIEMTAPNFGREGRIVHSKVLTKADIL
jgi:predicted amidohydrolase